MKHSPKRLLALALALSCAAQPAFAASAAVPIGDGRAPTCDEAYYATLDYYGNLTEGSVVKSYVLNGATSVTDYGAYEDVANLSNNVSPAQSGSRVSFDFSGEAEAPTHFYFQGKTDQPFNDLPWALSISYTLNGVPTKAEDLAGKTGVVEINIDAIPNRACADYARHNYTLETMAIFNQDDILSLEAPGAQVQLLGNLRAVLFVAFPGEEGHYSIRVGAESFSFGGMTFLMVPATLSQLDEISKLAQRKEDLETNYEKLSGSLDTLLDSLDAVSGSLYSSAGGLDALNAARDTISSGKGTVYEAADQTLVDLDAMAEALKPLSGELGAASDTLLDANAILSEMNASTVALREDLSTLDKTLKNVQGDKKDVLRAIEDIQALQEKLQDSSRSLDSLKTTSLNKISNPVGSQSGTLKSLGSAKDIYDAFVKAAGGIGGTVDEDAFVNAILAMKMPGKTVADLKAAQALGASKEAVYLAAYETAYLGALQSKGIPAAALGAMGGADVDAFQASADAVLDTLIAAGQLTDEQKAALMSGADEFAAGKATEAAAGFETYQALKGVYAAVGGGAALDFENFLTALATASTNDTEKASINKLLALYKDNPNTVADLISDPSEITSAAREIDDAVDDINESISSVNTALSRVTTASDDASELLDALADAVGNAGNLKSAVENVDDLTELARKDSAVLQSTLTSLEKLQKVLDAYQPKLDRTSADVQTAGEALRVTSVDTNVFLRSAENLLQTGGSQLDEATRQSLTSLAATLRGTAAAIGKNSGVRSAKESIKDVVEDVWNDYTGDVSDLLEMDATAAPVSLTDARNPSPTSVQVLIRTQEIKVEAADEASEVERVQEEPVKTTFWQRVSAMFAGMCSAIASLFHRG